MYCRSFQLEYNLECLSHLLDEVVGEGGSTIVQGRFPVQDTRVLEYVCHSHVLRRIGYIC